MMWLQAEIAAGFQRLVVLRLKNAPPEEVLLATVAVWLETLKGAAIAWDEVQDRDRVREAFNVLCKTCDSWPTPRLFFEVLPPRAPLPALPEPKYDKAKARANLAKIKAMLGKKTILKRF